MSMPIARHRAICHTINAFSTARAVSWIFDSALNTPARRAQTFSTADHLRNGTHAKVTALDEALSALREKNRASIIRKLQSKSRTPKDYKGPETYGSVKTVEEPVTVDEPILDGRTPRARYSAGEDVWTHLTFDKQRSAQDMVARDRNMAYGDTDVAVKDYGAGVVLPMPRPPGTKHPEKNHASYFQKYQDLPPMDRSVAQIVKRSKTRLLISIQARSRNKRHAPAHATDAVGPSHSSSDCQIHPKADSRDWQRHV
jgi:hypothetical protein